MSKRAINITLKQRLMVCFARLALIGSGLRTFRPVVCRSTRQLGSV